MAEKIIQFKAKKEIFDNGKTKSEWVQMGAEVAKTRLACSICKCVPWYNPNYDWARDVKIFQTGEGDVLHMFNLQTKVQIAWNFSKLLSGRFTEVTFYFLQVSKE